MTNSAPIWKYLSHPWGPSCPPYGNGEPVKFQQCKSMACGDSCNQLHFDSTNHIGTHYDFPFHFDPNGVGLDFYGPEFFIYNNVGIFNVTTAKGGLVSPESIEKSQYLGAKAQECEIVLLRTGASTYRNTPDFWQNGPGLGLGLAQWLRERFPKLRTVGVDTISITSYQHRETGRAVHKEFLAHAKALPLIEDLALEELNNKTPFQLLAIPLRLEGNADGAPCTVIGGFSS